MIDVLRRVLPAGTVTSQAPPDDHGARTPIENPSVLVTYRDGQGPAGILVGLDRLALPVSTDDLGCPDRARHPFDRCSQHELSDGSTLSIDQGYSNPINTHGIQQWSAVLTTAEGGQVSVMEWNAPSGHVFSMSRSAPPLNVARLTAVADAGGWRKALATLPVSPQPPTPPAEPEMTRQQIRAILERLLPAGLRSGNISGSAIGYLDMTLDDGRGQALLTVTVQKWKPDDPRIAQLFHQARTLPNGIKTTSRQIASPDGGADVQQWSADAFYPQGLRVLVSELNSSAFGLPATRKTPPLSKQQLASISINPLWG